MYKINKILLFTAMVFFLAGTVSAGGTLYNLTGIDIPLDVIAGNTFWANFSFDYLDDHVNQDVSPLIIQLNFSSENDDYPVWRNDFEVSGRIEKFALWGLISLPTIYFECNNSEVQVIDHPLDSETISEIGNGTFYCYNADGDLELEERDEVYLEISSHYALYPGKYDLTASMFYLTDERAPFVNITNKGMFEKYYREIDNVLVRATIEDGSGIAQKWSKVMINGAEIFDLSYDYLDEEEYYFSKNTPVDIIEGNYELFVFAEDEYGNEGNDSVVLKIDRSAPEISLVGWTGAVVSGILSIVADVVDGKSGVDEGSVEYRLREMDGSSICPEDGVGTWDCYNSGWILMDADVDDLFEVDVDTVDVGLNGEYWLEIRASDILGNMGVLE